MTLDTDDVPLNRSDRWQLTHVGVRVRWRHSVEPCERCERDVHLDRRHHYAALTSNLPGRVQHAADETVVFCSRRCREQWCSDG